MTDRYDRDREPWRHDPDELYSHRDERSTYRRTDPQSGRSHNLDAQRQWLDRDTWQPDQRDMDQAYGGPGRAEHRQFNRGVDWRQPGQYTGRGPRGYRRTDERIREDVCERLTQHGQLDASEIEVDVRNGIVTLRGYVENRQARRMAEETAEGVSGIWDVYNELRVSEQKSLLDRISNAFS